MSLLCTRFSVMTANYVWQMYGVQRHLICDQNIDTFLVNKKSIADMASTNEAAPLHFFSAHDLRILSDLSFHGIEQRQSSRNSLFRDTYEEFQESDRIDSPRNELHGSSSCADASYAEDPCPLQLALSSSSGSESFISSRRMLDIKFDETDAPQEASMDNSWGQFVDFQEEEKQNDAAPIQHDYPSLSKKVPVLDQICSYLEKLY